MTEPRARRAVHTRRWLITVIAACLLLAAANELVINQPLYRKAANVRLGQSLEEVKAVIGSPNFCSLRRQRSDIDRFYYGPIQSWWDWNVVHPTACLIGRSYYLSDESYPVVISFDANNRVSRIRYGRTLVE
jgi:hypothetical protein